MQINTNSFYKVYSCSFENKKKTFKNYYTIDAVFRDKIDVEHISRFIFIVDFFFLIKFKVNSSPK